MLHLRPPFPDDYGYLYQLLVAGENGAHWRFRGVTPTPDSFERTLWAGTVAMFVVELRGRRVGMSSIMNPLFEAQHAEFGLAIDDSVKKSGLAALISLQTIRHAFDSWPLRKLYVRVPGFNLAHLGDLTRFEFVEEGRLVDYSFSEGRFWDEHVLALDREGWVRLSTRYRRLLTRSRC